MRERLVEEDVSFEKARKERMMAALKKLEKRRKKESRKSVKGLSKNFKSAIVPVRLLQKH